MASENPAISRSGPRPGLSFFRPEWYNTMDKEKWKIEN
jgi:hypothetical protein